MMLVSVRGKSERAVSGAGWGVLMLFSIFGGGMVPLFVMSGWMQAVGSFSPAKWSVLSLEGAA
jgi:ABC-type multidrug transport system permease subunit